MSLDYSAQVKAVQKERMTLTFKLAALKKRQTKARTSLATMARDQEQIEARLEEIEHAFAPVAALLGAKPPERIRIAAPGAETQLVRIVNAIGKFGLRDWTPADVAAEAGGPGQSMGMYLTQLLKADRIRRMERGRYRTIQAKIA